MDTGPTTPREGGAHPAARRTSEALWKSEKTVAAILESASQAILSVDRRGRIVIANSRAGEMFGYRRDDLLGLTIEDLLPESMRSTHVQNRADYFAKPRVRPMGMGMELLAHRSDGVEFPVEISLSYVETTDGVFAIAFVTDISERKRMEAQLLQSQKMEAVGRLAGGVAHDFNNMLTVISGYNRMLLDQLAPIDPLRGYAEEVLKAADRAAALTNQLLAFSRRQIMQPKVIDLNALITDSERMLRRLIGEDLELVLSLRPGLGNIKADPSHIEQIVFNLVVNSRDAMPDGGRITIETADVVLDQNYVKTHFGVRPGRYLMMAVSDTGKGMDAETKNHIFEPFFTTKERGKGTGLGLSTVYGIVKQSGGDIWVYSEQGKGTTFKVYLPVVDENAAVIGPTARPKLAAGTETILVVEDEPGVRNLIATILDHAGYAVLKAEEPNAAIECARRHDGTIHLLVTDVVMPQLSGRQLAEKLCATRPGLRVLYISGYTENTVVHHGVLDSDVEFLSKPFTHESLVTRVRQILDKES